MVGVAVLLGLLTALRGGTAPPTRRRHRRLLGSERCRRPRTPRRTTAAAPSCWAPGAVTLGAAGAAAVGQRLSTAGGPSSTTLPAPVEAAPPLPPGLERTVRGITPLRTGNATFYRVDTNLTVPRVDADRWQLRVDGMVDRPFTLSYRQLLAMPMVERDITMTCVSNEVGGGYVGSARWLGVRLADVLDRAGVRDGADQLLSTAVDGFTISTPLDAAARRPGRAARRRDERRAAAGGPRLPRPAGGAGAVRLRQRDQVGHPADACRRTPGTRRTGRSGSGPPTRRSRSQPGSTPPGPSPP